MAKQFIVHYSLAEEYANDINAKINAGTTNAGGKVKIFPGIKPDKPEDAEGATELVSLDLPNPAFGAAAGNAAQGYSRITANAITPANATAAGDAAWYRVYDRDDNPVADGTVGTTDSDMIITTVTIGIGDQITVSSWTIDVPTVLP